MLKRLESESHAATPEEQATLVRYVGWGGIPQAFDHQNDEWRNEFHELSGLLSKSEYEAARRSTQDAHYTTKQIIQTIYGGLQRLGFDGGKIGEPAAGIGHFVGLMPQEMRAKSHVTAIELDPLTARIYAHLYPQSTIINKGYQDVTIPGGYFDAVVGNPPFGNQNVFDANHRDLSEFSIHNYFLAKSLDKTRAGGVVGVVVSSYFMDAQNTAARAWIADRAHLVGAMRLPNTAFKQNALTEVTTDILFFQKAHEHEMPNKEWVDTDLVRDPRSGKMLRLNQHLISHPDRILGEMTLTTGMHGDTPTCIEKPGMDLDAEMRRVIDTLPVDIYRAETSAVQDATQDTIDVPEHVKVGAFFVVGDRIARRLPDILNDNNSEWVEPKNTRASDRIKGMVEIRDTLRTLMALERAETASDEDVEAKRAALNLVYDSFVKKQGFITSLSNKQAFSDDPDYPLLLSLERDYDKGISKDIAQRDGVEPRDPSAGKAAIFHKRVITARREITRAGTPKDAMLVSLNEHGRIDMPFMMRLTGVSEDDLVKDLRGLVYLNPAKSRWESADQYLTGNVKKKLKEAAEASFNDPRFLHNAEALRNVQPADIDPVDIGIQLGATWVPPKVVDGFVGHMLGDVRRSINYQTALGKWIVKIQPSRDLTTSTVTWGTPEAPAHKLIESILRNTPIQVKEETGRDDRNNPIYTVNDEKTAVANQKADEIKQAFVDWVWEDKDRRDTLGRLYNDTFNTNVPPRYDGSHLTLPGASLAVTLRPHQKDYIWRGLQEGGGIADHTVGAGKTFELIGIAMESRRMGLANKPMIAVPNHLLLQWKDSFYELYPDAQVLIAEKTDFKRENREKLFSRIATGDWDAVIIGHSSLKKIGMPHDTLTEILTEQVDDLTDAIRRMKEDKGDRITIKQMEKTRDRMQAKMERAASATPKDKVVTFDELGVDQLMVDELHEFKNLFINTSLSRVSGLGDLGGSDKAFDLFVKGRYLQKKHEGRGLYGATGTPISNTIAELYTVMRYTMYEQMKERGIEHFDAWASAFGQVVTGWELDATGVNYKLNSRFAKFQNVPELIALYRTVADVITPADLQRQAMEQGKRFPVPKLKDGKPRNVIVERSELQAKFMGVQVPMLGKDGQPFTRADGTIIKQWSEGSIIHRMENLPTDPSKDNPLKITNDARKAGLDYRLIDPTAPDFEGSKVNALVAEVLRIHEAWKEQRGTQLIFSDLSTPSAKGTPAKAKMVTEVTAGDDAEQDQEHDEPQFSMDELLAGSSRFSVYDDVRQKLIAHGIPADEVRFIHEAKTDLQKAKLFAAMNEGRVRVLMGSTAKMGAGTNVQKKLVAIHDLDAPWRPSDLEQRHGRGLRQGNEFYAADPENFRFEILQYATKQTYDSRMWQTIEVKAAGIEQFRRGDSLQRTIEDVASEAANAAEMKAAATGNPLIFMQVQISADLKKMEAMYANHKRNAHWLENKIEYWKGSEARGAKQIAAVDADIQRRDQGTTDPWTFTRKGQRFNNESKETLSALVVDAMKSAVQVGPKNTWEPRKPLEIGEYRGFAISVEAWRDRDGDAVLGFKLKGDKETTPGNLQYVAQDKFSIGGFISRLDNYLDGLEERKQDVIDQVMKDKADLVKAQSTLAKPFPGLAKLEMLRQDASEVLVELKKMQTDDNYVSKWKARSIDGSNEKGTVSAVPTGELFTDDGGSAQIVVGLAETAKAALASPAVAFEKLPAEEAVKLHPSLAGAFHMLAQAKHYATQKFGEVEDQGRFMEQTRKRIADNLRQGKEYPAPENGRER